MFPSLGYKTKIWRGEREKKNQTPMAIQQKAPVDKTENYNTTELLTLIFVNRQSLKLITELNLCLEEYHKYIMCVVCI